MSLLPMHSVFPTIFLEARVHGVPSAIISQIGLSLDAPDYSVAVFSKASGVLLVAGVGSYCAYRICTKLLGNRFYWMMLDRTAFERIATADRRLLYGNHINLDGCEVLELEDEEGDRRSEEDFRERMSVVSRTSQMTRSSIFRRFTRARGLLAIRHGSRSREGVLSRRSTSVAASEVSSAASEVSASLRIVWEGEHIWEDEFAEQNNNTGGPTPRAIMVTSTPYRNSQAPSMGDLCSVFDEVMSVTSGLDHEADDALYQDEGGSSVDEKSPVFKNIKCFTDSSYMYHSVMDGSEMGSECGISMKSTGSVLSNLRRKKVDANPGLWSLSSEKPCTSLQVKSDNRMISSTTSKRSSNMFDSAIGTSMTSSDDESVDFSRNRLDRVTEADSLSLAPTEMSMEWFDDDGIRPSTTSDVNAFDWDLDAPCGSKDMFAVAAEFVPSEYTDLMLFASENFEQYSSQFKLMYNLYYKRRLKRIGGKSNSEDNAKEQSRMILSQALYHRHRILSEEKLAAYKEIAATVDWLPNWRSLSEIKTQLEALKDLYYQQEVISEVHLKGLEAALVLEAITVTQLEGALTEWLPLGDFKMFMQRFERNLPFNEAAWSLLSRLIDVSLEVIDVNSVGASSVQIGTSPYQLTWLKVGNSLMPLYTVPDD